VDDCAPAVDAELADGEADAEGDAEAAADEELPDDEHPATVASTPTAAATTTAAGRARRTTDDTVHRPQIWLSVLDNVSPLSPPGRCCRTLRPQ